MTFAQLIADVFHPFLANLGDVHEAVLAGQDIDEGAEIHEFGHPAFIDPAYLDIRRDLFHPLQGRVAGGLVGGRDLDGAVVLNINGRAGLLGDRADRGTALADHIADLVRVDLYGGNARRKFGHLGLMRGQHRVHFFQDMQAPLFGLMQRGLHDFPRDAVYLDVHLQCGDALRGAGHLEIHIAQVVLIAHDVGQHHKALAFLDQAHGDPGHGRVQADASVHQREAAAADRGHGAGTVGFGDLRDHPDRIGILAHIRHDPEDAALGQAAMTDLAPLGGANPACFVDAVRREVVVKHERFLALAFYGVDDLRVALGAERGHH